MGFLDKLLGRDKDTSSGATDDAETKQAGAHQEMQEAGESTSQQANEMAQEAREERAEHRAEREET